MKTQRYTAASDDEILRQFFAGERNSVGDYWGMDTIKAVVGRLQARLAAAEARAEGKKV